MKALTVRQPWASLIISGIKNIENRTWVPKYSGKLAIHAAKTITQADIDAAREMCESIGAPFPIDLPRGGIIGVVDFFGILATEGDTVIIDHPNLTDGEVIDMDVYWYNPGMIGWILEHPVACRFVPYTGRLGLFDIPDNLIITS
jgi:hypothetical protein